MAARDPVIKAPDPGQMSGQAGETQSGMSASREMTRGGHLNHLQVAVPVMIGLLGLLLQSQTFLNHDVAWVLHSSGWLLEGGRFGRDIIAANPPFIWWLSEIPMALSMATGLDPVQVFRLFAIAILSASLVSSNWIMARAGLSPGSRALFLAVAALVFTIGVQRDFGQREFLTVLLILPYLCAAALRLRGGRLPLAAGVAFGLCAGYGIAFKPYFVAVVLPVELLLLWKLRSLRPVLRPEALGAVAAVGLCALGVFLFAMPWLNEVLPEITRTYWGFNQSLAVILLDNLLPLGLLTIGALAIIRAGGPLEAVLLTLAAAGFAVSGLLQGKGYSYHFFPVTACMVLALSLAAMQPEQMRRLPGSVFRIALVLSLATGLLGLYQRSELGPAGQEISQVADFVERSVPEEASFFAFSTHPFPGFPTAFAADRRWGSPSNSSLFLPSVIRLSGPDAPAGEQALALSREKAIAAALRDIKAGPELVLIDIRKSRHAINEDPFDYLAFYLTDPEFRQLWSGFEKMETAPDGFLAFRKVRDGK